MLFGPCTAVDIISGIGLGNENSTLGVHSHSVKQSAEGIDGLDKLVGFDIENEQIPIGYAGMFYDIGDMPKRQNIVIGNGVLMGIKGNEFAIDLVPARKLGLIIRLERNDIKPAITNHNTPGILSRNLQEFDHFSGSDIHHRDFVLR